MILLLLVAVTLLQLTNCGAAAMKHGRQSWGVRRVGGMNNSWDDVVILAKNYNGDHPPTFDDESTRIMGTHYSDSSGSPVSVSMQLEILRDLMVDEMQGEITIDSFLTTRWRDTRIQVNSTAFMASAMGDRVIVNARTSQRLWKPDIVFVPMEQLALTRGMKPVKLLALSKDGELTYKIGCTITLLCAMDFSNFPFDVQECKWRIYSFRHSHRFVNLTWGARPLQFRAAQGRITEMKQPQFGMRFITGRDDEEFSEHKSNMLLLKVLLHRDLRSHILVTYFPSALFVSVSWGSFLVSPEVVPGRMVLLVTTLLTLVTMLNTVRQTTPESEEIKPIEVWIVTCIGFVVLALFEYFVVLYVLRCRTTWHQLPSPDAESGEAHPSWLPYCLRTKPGAFDMLSFLLFPTFFLFFNIYYWVTCLSEMHRQLEKVGLKENIYNT